MSFPLGVHDSCEGGKSKRKKMDSCLRGDDFYFAAVRKIRCELPIQRYESRQPDLYQWFSICGGLNLIWNGNVSMKAATVKCGLYILNYKEVNRLFDETANGSRMKGSD